MQATKKNIYAPTPNTQRGKPCVLNGDPKGKNFLYATGSAIIIRNIDDPLQCDIYDQHSHATTVARYAPSGFYIASGDVSGLVKIWDTVNAEHILKAEYKVLGGSVLDIVWSPDSQRLIVVGDGKERYGAAILADSGASVGEIGGHSKPIYSCDFKSSRPYRAATGSEDQQANWYEGPPFKYKQALRDHTRFVNCVRFSPDGNKLLTVGLDKKGFVYDGKTGDKVGELSADNAHQGGIYACSWSPDGNKILTASGDKTAKIWDANTLQCTTTFTFGSGVESQQLGCLWQGNHLLSVSLSGDINYLDVNNPSRPLRVLMGHNKLITTLSYDRNSSKFYTGSYDGAVIQWDSANGATQGFSGQGHTNQVNKAVVQGDTMVSCGLDDCVRFTPLSTKQYAADKVALGGPVLDLSAGRNDLVVAVTEMEVVLLRAGRVVNTVKAAYGPGSVALSVDETEASVGGKDGSIHVYTVSGNALAEKNAIAGAHRGAVNTIAYSPDGRHLASSGADREVVAWDANSKERKNNGWVFHSARVNSLSWSPDSEHLASASLDCSVIVWTINQPTSRVQIRNAHFGGVNAVTWLDNNTVASAGQDCATKTWTIKY